MLELHENLSDSAGGVGEKLNGVYASVTLRTFSGGSKDNGEYEECVVVVVEGIEVWRVLAEDVFNKRLTYILRVKAEHNSATVWRRHEPNIRFWQLTCVVVGVVSAMNRRGEVKYLFNTVQSPRILPGHPHHAFYIPGTITINSLYISRSSGPTVTSVRLTIDDSGNKFGCPWNHRSMAQRKTLILE